MLWFGERGAAVFMPVFHSPDFDLIADWGTGLVRVQVKTSSAFRKGRWDVSVCTRGGNRSWSGLVNYLDPRKYDHLFVLVGDGRRGSSPRSRWAVAPAFAWADRSTPSTRSNQVEPLRAAVPTID